MNAPLRPQEKAPITTPVEDPKPVAASGVEIVSFGCRLNVYESELIRKAAHEDGLEDAIIFNTCAVTSEAVRQVRQAIRRARREQPERRVIVTGCAAQTDPDAFARMIEVDFIIGNDQKGQPGSYAFTPDTARIRVNDIFAVKTHSPHLIDGLKDRARAFVEIQNGCDHRCTFCIIPYGRGASRSAASPAVIDQCQRLVDQGYNEIVLTGVDLTSWGGDLPGTPALGHLVRRILKMVPDLKRLRLSSIDAAEIDPVLLDTFATEDRLAPYFHLSLQHGDDLILKRMKRRHSRAEAIALCEAVRRVRPDVAFGADLIAGFPTEDEAAFENSVRLVEDCGLSFLHVFPYSARPGTPAARMPQLPRPIIKARAEALRRAGQAALIRHLDRQSGRQLDCVIEREGAGRAADFTEVAFSGHAPIGSLSPLHVIGHDGRRLVAHTLPQAG